jgi:GMP reductase
MNKSYSYKDVVILPSYSEVRSRSSVCVQRPFGPRVFAGPAIPSNMICTINFDIARTLSENDCFYILHRFYPYDEILSWVRDNQSLKTISISVGVGEKDRKLLKNISKDKLNLDYITIDVAHGHHILVKEMIRFIKSIFPEVFLIVGNIGSTQAAYDLSRWGGVDAVKVGLSMGKSCTTYNCTGVGSPMFSTVKDIASLNYFPLIADGQVREVGDVCKALAAGAQMVMIGSEFARCIDSPAETIKQLECPTAGIHTYHKKFFGSASTNTKGVGEKYIEGAEIKIPMKNVTYLEYIEEIKQGVQSFLSYIGKKDIKYSHMCDFRLINK